MADNKPKNSKDKKEVDHFSKPLSQRIMEAESNISEGLAGFGDYGATSVKLGTTPFGESQYDTEDIRSEFALNPQILEQIRGERQGWGAELANAVGGGLAKLPFSVIGNVGSMLDFEDYYNTDDEVGNWLTTWAEEKKGNIEEATRIYKSNENTLSSREWWMQNGKELINSAGAFVVTGAGLGAGVSTLASVLKGSRLLAGAVETIGTVANATMLNQAESIPIAMGVFDKAYKTSLDKYALDIENGRMSIEDAEVKARQEAADAAAYSVNINRINIPLNLTSAGAFVRTLPMTRQLAKDYSKKEVLRGILGEGAQEYVEENVNMLAENEALRKAELGKEYSFNFDRVVDDVLSKEGFEQGIVGFVGGAVQTAGTRLVTSFQKKSLSYDENGDVKFDETGKPVLVTERQSQEERFRAQKKNLTNIETLAKFEGVPTVKETLDKIRTTGMIQSEMQEAAIKGDQTRLDILKNELLTDQAVSAFKTGTTGQLINMYNSISRDPNGKSKYGDDFMQKSSEAIKTIEALEKVYIKYATLPQVNELINNRSQADYLIKQAQANKLAMAEAQRNLQAEIEATGFTTPELIETLTSSQEIRNLKRQQDDIAANVVRLTFEFNQLQSPDYAAKKMAQEQAKAQAEAAKTAAETATQQSKQQATKTAKPSTEEFNPFEGAEVEDGPVEVRTPSGQKKTDAQIIAESLSAEDLADEFAEISDEDLAGIPGDDVSEIFTDIEAKKADIERRRQENLEDTGDAFDYVSKQPRKDGKFNAFYTTTKESAIFDSYQEAVDWINSKYDAELAALESKSTKDIEVKKADIEKRLKEEIISLEKEFKTITFKDGNTLFGKNESAYKTAIDAARYGIKELFKRVLPEYQTKADRYIYLTEQFENAVQKELAALEGKPTKPASKKYTVEEVRDAVNSLSFNLIVNPNNDSQYVDTKTLEVYDRVTSLSGKDFKNKEAADRGSLIDAMLRTFIGGNIETISQLELLYESLRQKTDFLGKLEFGESLPFSPEFIKDLFDIFSEIKNQKITLITNVRPLAGTVNGKKVAGTVDLIGVTPEGNVYIIDLKTSTQNRRDPSGKFFEEYKKSDTFQQSYYAELFRQNTGIDISNITVLPIQVFKTNNEYTNAVLNKSGNKLTMEVAIDRSIFPELTVKKDEQAFNKSNQVNVTEKIEDTTGTKAEEIEIDDVDPGEVLAEDVDLEEDEVIPDEADFEPGDQEMANTYNSKGAEYERAPQVKLDFGDRLVDDKEFAGYPTAGMMSLYEGYKTTEGFYIWERDENGMPISTGSLVSPDVSKADVGAVGSEITFKVVELTPEQDRLNRINIEKSKRTIFDDRQTDNIYGYSDADGAFEGDVYTASIAAVDKNNNILFFVPLPHAISKNTTVGLDLMTSARKKLLAERAEILRRIANGTAVTTIKEKGNGKLFNQVNENFRPVVKSEDGEFINLFDMGLRPTDMVNNRPVFAYGRGTSFVVPTMGDPDIQEEIDAAVAKLGDTAKSGQIYMMVKAANGNWMPVPVFTTIINDKGAKDILDTINKFNEGSDFNTIISELQDKIFTAGYLSGKKAPIRVINPNEFEGWRFVVKDENGTDIFYSLNDLKTNEARRREFTEYLKLDKRNNIDVKKLNSAQYQSQVKNRGALTTNARLDVSGSYFVQPFIAWNPLVNAATELNKELAETRGVNTNQEPQAKIDLDFESKIGYDSSEDVGEAFSKKAGEGKPLDRTAFRKWLDTYLPGLNVSDVDQVAEVKGAAKDSVGMFHNMLIYLFQGATNRTAYHEAFHGVFRNMLSKEARLELINEAKQKYKAPTKLELDAIAVDLRFNATQAQLENIYYEEQMADDFAKYVEEVVPTQTIFTKIKNFFKKILNYFNLISTYSPHSIERVYDNIMAKKYKKASMDARAIQDIIDRRISENFAPAYSKINGLTIRESSNRTRALVNSFMVEFQKARVAGTSINADDVFKKLYQHYVDLHEANKIDPNVDKEVAKVTINVLRGFGELVANAKKNLKTLGFKNLGSNEIIDFTDGVVESEKDPESGEVSAEDGKTSRDFGMDLVKMPGLKSATTRMKLFLGAIPVINRSGKPQVDKYKLQQYYDFKSTYYYIERVLVGHNTLEEMLKALKKLSPYKPELKYVIDTLEGNNPDYIGSELDQLRADFRANFSKQMLGYVVAKIDFGANGLPVVDIFESNRNTVGRDIYDSWTTNLEDPVRASTTIAESNGDGTVTVNGTDKAKVLYNSFVDYVKLNKAITPNLLSMYLNRIGIVLSPEVIDANVKDAAKARKIIAEVTDILKFYSQTSEESSKEGTAKRAREAKWFLVGLEEAFNTHQYTTSFNNVENSVVYAIQNPSYMSKLMSNLTNVSEAKFNEALVKYKDDPYYKYNNLLQELEDPTFRTKQFKMFYLDGLVSVKSSRKGKKYTKINTEDFLALELALFMNNTTNKQKMAEKPTAKYLSSVPSDKTMVTLLEGKRYGVDANISVTGDTISVNVNPNSEIVEKYYNAILNEANRIKSAINLQAEYERLSASESAEDRTTAEGIKKGLRQRYHYKTSPTSFDGEAFKFTEFSFLNNTLLPVITDAIKQNPTADIKAIMDEIFAVEGGVRDNLMTHLNKLAYREIVDMISKNVINISKDGVIKPIKMDIAPGTTQEQLANIITGFTLNKSLNLIDTENIFNGDPAYYKDANLELLKRFYQKQAMTISIDDTKISNKNVLLTDDVEIEGITDKEMNPLYKVLEKLKVPEKVINKIKKAYSKPNRTDAQVWISPELFKELHEARGTWTPQLQTAYDVAMGTINPATLTTTDWHRQLAAIKPFGFGLQQNAVTKSMEPIQLKCSMMPLFPSITKGNPLLTDMAKAMKDSNTSMIVTKSALKAMMPQLGNLDSMEDLINNQLEFPFKDLGFQVDNPDHLFEENNDALRQMRMLMMGMIDPRKKYREDFGINLINKLSELEAAEIESDLEGLLDEINVDKDNRFKARLKEALTMRNSNRNVEKVLDVVDGKFAYPLAMSNVATEVQNLISSIFTKAVVKQGFTGGSAVQASDVGFTMKSNFKDLDAQQAEIEKSPVLKALQKGLKYLSVEGTEGMESITEAECILPAWAQEFYTVNPTTGSYELKDIGSIPKELKQLIVYRIPYEGPHSTLPVKVVKFLAPEMGNFIILPGQIVAQFGSDFDFDKMYFIGRHGFVNDKNEFVVSRPSKEQKMDDTYKSWTPEQRQNEIFDIYWRLLTSPENLQYMLNPSGFAEIEAIARKINTKSPMKMPSGFYTGITQRLFKDIAHQIIDLKGQSVLHGTGHAYSTKLPTLSSKVFNVDGTFSQNKSYIRFDGRKYNNFSRMYDNNGNLITDELMSMTAAILDAIKNPQILHAININNDSIDLWSTIVRSGVGIESASYFTAQPIIREITAALSSNRKEIRGRGNTSISRDSIYEKYENRYNELLDIVNTDVNVSSNFFEEYDKVLGINESDPIGTLQTKMLDKYSTFSPDFSSKTMSPQKAAEEALFLKLQLKVYDEYLKIDAIAKALVKINRFLSVNKQVGPDLETILDKIDLWAEISSPDFIIEGFNTKKLPVLDSYVKALFAARDILAKDFPEATLAFQEFKNEMAKTVTSTGLVSDLNIDDKKKISRFFKLYTERNMDMFKDLASRERQKYLLWDFPSKVMDIKNIKNDEKFLNGQLRKSAVFQNLQVERVKDKNFGYIKVKANRLDPDIKNIFAESLLAMGSTNNPQLTELVKDLIDHSMLTTGLAVGLNSYHTLIAPELLEKFGYTQELDKYMTEYQGGEVPSSQFMNLAVKQFIQNNSKGFTQVYDKALFIQEDANTYTLTKAKANKDSWNKAKRSPVIGPMPYIQIYESGKPSKLLELSSYSDDSITYKVINYLGSPAKLIEVDATKDIPYSFIKSNNRVIKSNSNAGKQTVVPSTPKVTPETPQATRVEEVDDANDEADNIDGGDISLESLSEMPTLDVEDATEDMGDYEGGDYDGDPDNDDFTPDADDLKCLPGS